MNALVFFSKKPLAQGPIQLDIPALGSPTITVTKPLLRTLQTALDTPIHFLLRCPIDAKTDAHLGARFPRT